MRRHGGSLPVQLTSYFGREIDQAEVLALLQRARLVSLVGPGGAGKTRLALRVAQAEIDTGTPVHWVELAPAADAEAVTRSVQMALGARDDGATSTVEGIATALGPARSVLVLDNCEHQLDAVSRLVRNLLADHPGVAVLTTTREPLGMGGETTWDVLPLAGPGDDPDLSADDVLATPAGQLFVDRARAASPAFRLEDIDASAVGHLIRRLDGLPLALELAAVRCRAMSPASIAEALEDRFAVLVGGDRTATARQQTLQASVDWSHDLLPDSERTLLRRLGIFAGTFTARAAEAVTPTGDLSMGQVLPALVRLVDKSLVVRVPGESTDRYRLLESIRAFALDQLDRSGERDEVARRHRQFFAGRSAAIAVGIDDRNRQEILPVVDLEHPDLDQARTEALADDDPASAAGIVADLTRYWCARGLYRAARDAQAQVLPHVHALDPGVAARLLWGAAHTALCEGDVFTAGVHALNAVHLARQGTDGSTLARALAAQGGSLAALDPAAAAAVFAEAAEIARAAGDRWALGVSLSETGMAHIYVGQGRATEELAEAQEIGTSLGDSSMLAWHSVAVGWLANRDGEFVAAEVHLRDAIAFARDGGDQTPIELATAFLAESLAWQGRIDEALAQIEPILDHLEQQEAAALLGPMRLEMGNVLLLAGRAPEALASFQAGLAHPVTMLVPYMQAQANLGIGACLLAVGNPAGAVEALQVCRALEAHASSWVQSMSSLLLGESLRRIGDGSWLSHCVRGLEQASAMGFGAVEIEAIELVAAEVAGRGGDDAVLAGRLVGAARAGRAARSVLPGVPGLSRGEEATARILELLGDEKAESAFAAGATLGLGGATRLALATLSGDDAASTRRPATGWDALTPAELRVAELAARGLSNPRIAEDLFISRETVKSHLSRIYVKVNLQSRAELAAAWATRD